MRLYNCKIRLNAELHNEVRKSGLTAAELMLLHRIHGADSVIEIEAAGKTNRSHDEERARLFNYYVAEATDTDGSFAGGVSKGKLALFNLLFGPEHNPLPTELPKNFTVKDPDEKPTRRRDVKSGAAEDVARDAALA